MEEGGRYTRTCLLGFGDRRLSRSSVALVTPSFLPMIGGIENYVLGIGPELVGLGHKVDVYTPDSVLGRDLRAGPEEVAGMKIHRIPVSVDFSYRLKLWPSLSKELKREDPDLIHVYSHDSYALMALGAARSLGVPFVITTYGRFETNADYGPLQAGLFRVYDSLVSPRLFKRSNIVMIRYP